MRKVLIGLTAFGIVLIGFWVYIAVMDPGRIQTPQATDIQATDMSDADTGSQPMGDVELGPTNQARYFRYHPVTKNIVAEYGFEKLLNPSEGSTRWQVEKPYLVFYQPDYKCRIDSEEGTFEIEMVGDQGVPKDAQLEENVIIHITPNPGSRIAETTIYMDDLAFSSERSEFSTDGPVNVQSSQLQLEGYGVVLIFNTGIGKVEYMQIKDVDSLRLRGFASSMSSSESQSAEMDKRETKSLRRQSVDRTTALQTTQTMASSPDVSPRGEDDLPGSLYQCAIRDNVVIQYGDKLVVSGADMVDISNLRFSSMNADTAEENAADDRSVRTARAEARSSAPRPAVSKNTRPARPQESEAPGASQDVVVNCDGGIIIQPMQSMGAVHNNAEDSELAFEMSGAPLKINRVHSGSGKKPETLAHCGALSYKPAEDILRLFTSQHQPQILLSAQESNSRIETCGNVAWDRRAQRANIAGPGKVYIGNTKNPAVQPNEISFYGMMDLLFAQRPNGDVSSATIRTINLTGGMDAILRQNGTLKTLADSAVLEFGSENELFEAHLDGDVLFESLEAGKPSSQAAAESAVFYFDNNRISTADLTGAVHFISASGRMDSPNARIAFAPDVNGAMQPKMIRTEGRSVLQALASESTQPAARFEAGKIDYDMQTGMGLAHGPIRFTFYQPADPQDAPLEPWIPVTVTADESAQFFADADRTIRQVIFNKNVVASRIRRTAFYTQRDEFHGDKMIVDVDKTPAGSADIRRITFAKGRVFGESAKLQGEKVLFKVRLSCREMVYDQSSGVVQAAGPGQMQLNNSNAESFSDRENGISFRRPCYAVFEGFDSIRWNLNSRHITADGDEKTMQLAYIPLVDGEPQKYIYVNSRRIEADYATELNGKPAVKRIFSDKGITYTEKDEQNKKIKLMLIGQTLEYDAVSDVGWLTITGSEANPCFLNGNRVPAIRYNVNTGRWKTSLSSVPGVLRNRR